MPCQTRLVVGLALLLVLSHSPVRAEAPTSCGSVLLGGKCSNNPPWYPSLAAFEHHDSGRSHLFPQARFGGSFSGPNTVATLKANTTYPSPWNITYLDSRNAFLYGGASGDDPSSIGAYVA